MRSMRERAKARKYAILTLSLQNEGKFVTWVVGRLIREVVKQKNGYFMVSLTKRVDPRPPAGTE